MPRRRRFASGGFVYHVLNRAVARDRLFRKPADYQAFEDVLYQGRFKSFPIQTDEHFWTVCRTVERNALKRKRGRESLTGTARRVLRIKDSRPLFRFERKRGVGESLWQRVQGGGDPGAPGLDAWPVPAGREWLETVNRAETEAELAALRRSVTRGAPFGDTAWQERTAKRLGLESTLRPRGRPSKKEER